MEEQRKHIHAAYYGSKGAETKKVELNQIVDEHNNDKEKKWN